MSKGAKCEILFPKIPLNLSMKEIIIEIEEKKYDFFLDLLKNFDFVSIKKTSRENDLLFIARSMKEAKLASEGKIKSRSAKSFLNEI